jgi:hypothetical protein
VRHLLHQSLDIDPNYAGSYAALTDADVADWVNPENEDYLNPAVLERRTTSRARPCN